MDQLYYPVIGSTSLLVQEITKPAFPCFVHMEDQANKRLQTTSPVKNAVDPLKNDYQARMSAIDTELTKMKYLTALMIHTLNNAGRYSDTKERFKEALEKVKPFSTKAANDESWKFKNERELQRYNWRRNIWSYMCNL